MTHSIKEKYRVYKQIGHVMRRDESNIIKRVMTMNVDGHSSTSRLRKRRMDCVKDIRNKRSEHGDDE
jgi:hypothetical protein